MLTRQGDRIAAADVVQSIGYPRMGRWGREVFAGRDGVPSVCHS